MIKPLILVPRLSRSTRNVLHGFERVRRFFNDVAPKQKNSLAEFRAVS